MLLGKEGEEERGEGEIEEREAGGGRGSSGGAREGIVEAVKGKEGDGNEEIW